MNPNDGHETLFHATFPGIVVGTRNVPFAVSDSVSSGQFPKSVPF